MYTSYFIWHNSLKKRKENIFLEVAEKKSKSEYNNPSVLTVIFVMYTQNLMLCYLSVTIVAIHYSLFKLYCLLHCGCWETVLCLRLGKYEMTMNSWVLTMHSLCKWKHTALLCISSGLVSVTLALYVQYHTALGVAFLLNVSMNANIKAVISGLRMFAFFF